MEDEKEGIFDKKKLVTYVSIAVVLSFLALLSFLIVPQSGTMESCTRLLLENSRYECLGNLAVASLNASTCGFIKGNGADVCYLQIAQKTNNSMVCSKISNSTLTSSCIISIAQGMGDYAMCSSAGEPYASKCEANVAVKVNDMSLCTGISNSTYNIKCSSIINGKAALLLRSPGFCKKVTNVTDKSTSSYIIFNISQSNSYAPLKDSSFMQSALVFLPNVTYTARDFCYTSVATLLGNETVCDKVTQGQAMMLCTAQANSASQSNATANYTQMLSACASAGAYAQSCVNQVTLAQAAGTGNATLCGTLGIGLQPQCYSLLASTYKDSTYCDYISDSSLKDGCMGGAR